MNRFLGSRLSAAVFATTLLGVVVVGAASSAAASRLTWSEVANPLATVIPTNTPGVHPILLPAGTDLSSVSCTGKRFCVAVGTHGADGPTLTEVWDGKQWWVSPGSGVQSSTLTAVSCTGPKFCVAVGYSNFGHIQPIVDTFNGVGWMLSTLDPVPTSPDSELDAVSCTRPNACVAAGYTSDGTTRHTLVEAWNGVVWSRTASPDAGVGSNALSGVSCVRTTFCVAVGSYVNASSNFQPLIETWRGSSWTITASPSPSSATSAALSAVSCVADRFCMTVGVGAGAGAGTALVETSHGGAWSIAASPAARAAFTQAFEGVSCTSAHRCVAVDSESGPTPGSATGVAQEWNGSGWAAGGGNSGTSGALRGVSCAGRGFCFAVGGSHFFPHGSVALLGK